MGSFLRTNINDETLVRGAARLLYAPISITFPTTISDLIVLTTGATQYDTVSAWADFGATKTGIQITRNNAEEGLDVDQILTDIASFPTNWEMSVATQLAQMNLENIKEAWEGGTVVTNTGTSPDEKQLPLGAPGAYTQRRLAVLFQRPQDNTIRAYVFRKAQRSPQESTFTHQKTGEQITVPMRWKLLADDSISDLNARFGVIYDQKLTG